MASQKELRDAKEAMEKKQLTSQRSASADPIKHVKKKKHKDKQRERDGEEQIARSKKRKE